MKRGCLFYLIFSLAVLTASLYYIFNVHKRDVISPAGREIKYVLYNKILRQLRIKMEQNLSDSLKFKLGKIGKSLSKNLNKMNYNSLKKFYKDFSQIIKQNIPDLNKLTLLEKKIEQYGK